MEILWGICPSKHLLTIGRPTEKPPPVDELLFQKPEPKKVDKPVAEESAKETSKPEKSNEKESGKKRKAEDKPDVEKEKKKDKKVKDK